MAAGRIVTQGSLVADAHGLTLASVDDGRVQAAIRASYAFNRRRVVSSVTLAEVLRGTSRDANLHRALGNFDTIPADDEIAGLAGRLLRVAPHRSKSKSRTIDAVVCATALLRAPRPIAILTSAATDIEPMLDGAPGVKVIMLK
ncbi:MAG TPA: hypothetical protein VFU74_20580 [Actinocrinis sp.]|nr:hypothetical protein [Actinocrinis sp.]